MWNRRQVGFFSTQSGPTIECCITMQLNVAETPVTVLARTIQIILELSVTPVGWLEIVKCAINHVRDKKKHFHNAGEKLVNFFTQLKLRECCL